MALLDVDAAKDSVAALEARGWIATKADGKLELTAFGMQQNAKLAEVAYSAEAAKLAQFSAAEINTSRQVIGSLGGRLDNIPAYHEER